jgi:hypothetical protein
MGHKKGIHVGNDYVKWSSDHEKWQGELDSCANDYIRGFVCGFCDLDLELWKRVWKSGKVVGICWWVGIWKSIY